MKYDVFREHPTPWDTEPSGEHSTLVNLLDADGRPIAENMYPRAAAEFARFAAFVAVNYDQYEKDLRGRY